MIAGLEFGVFYVDWYYGIPLSFLFFCLVVALVLVALFVRIKQALGLILYSPSIQHCVICAGRLINRVTAQVQVLE